MMRLMISQKQTLGILLKNTCPSGHQTNCIETLKVICTLVGSVFCQFFAPFVSCFVVHLEWPIFVILYIAIVWPNTFFFFHSFVCSLLWAGVQPTLDPNAEAFCMQAQCASPGGEGIRLVSVCECMHDV